MTTAEMLHEAFNTTQPPYVPNVAWSDLSESAQAKYEGMAYCLNRDDEVHRVASEETIRCLQLEIDMLRTQAQAQGANLAVWTSLQNAPSYVERYVKRFQPQTEEAGV